MQQRYMLDTDTSSYAMRGYSKALRLKLRHMTPGALCISAITAAELLQGLRPQAAHEDLPRATYSFLAGMDLLSWDLAAAEAYADIRFTLQRAGLVIGQSDMMIAAHALALDAVLVTNHMRHFSRLAPPLRLENWTEA